MGLATALAIGGLVASGVGAYSAYQQSRMDIETPDPPPVPETGEDEEDYMQRQRKRRGRSKTILTGDLTPETIGRKTLLGG